MCKDLKTAGLAGPLSSLSLGLFAVQITNPHNYSSNLWLGVIIGLKFVI